MTPEWFVPVATIIAALLAFAGGLVGHFVTSKRARKELEATSQKNVDDLQQRMMDQLQEDRQFYAEQVKEVKAEMTAQQERHDAQVERLNIRITGFYVEKSASRKYITQLQAREAELFAHILLGGPPPPPGASPIPPDGYVP